MQETQQRDTPDPDHHRWFESRSVCVVCGAPAEKGDVCLMCWVEGE